MNRPQEIKKEEIDLKVLFFIGLLVAKIFACVYVFLPSTVILLFIIVILLCHLFTMKCQLVCMYM